MWHLLFTWQILYMLCLCCYCLAFTGQIMYNQWLFCYCFSGSRLPAGSRRAVSVQSVSLGRHHLHFLAAHCVIVWSVSKPLCDHTHPLSHSFLAVSVGGEIQQSLSFSCWKGEYLTGYMIYVLWLRYKAGFWSREKHIEICFPLSQVTQK